MVQHGTVLSDVLSQPGPTHSVVDAIAAVVQATGCGPSLAMLGFAGGGIVAPLRALGGAQRVAAVDLDESGWRLFRRLSSSWAQSVTFHKADACDWLRALRHDFDVIIEDLSVPVSGNVCKPLVSWRELPPRIFERLKPGGVVVFNLLHPPGMTWEQGIRSILKAGLCTRMVLFEEFENRLIIVGRRLPAARTLSLQIRANLNRLHSRLASRISVRSCPVEGAEQ